MATAVYMNEVKGRLTLAVRTFVNAMSGTPSIVAGLFIFAVWIIQFHQTFSGFAASLALSILMLPTVTRTSEEVLRLVPGRPPRGLAGAGRPGVADGLVGGAADRAQRPDHRRHPRRRPRRR